MGHGKHDNALLSHETSLTLGILPPAHHTFTLSRTAVTLPGSLQGLCNCLLLQHYAQHSVITAKQIRCWAAQPTVMPAVMALRAMSLSWLLACLLHFV